ncbi:cytochrome P450 [Amylostereum chailletii]|nr:cytochrome P450 [Amylostereum chailletii]
MGVFFVAQAAIFACLFTAVIVVSRRYLVQRALRVVPGPPSLSFWAGNLKQMFTPNALAFHAEIQRQFEKVVRIQGFLGDQQLLISDPKALHSILVKDQHTFEESEWMIESRRVGFGPGLLSTLGAQHRKQRKILNPAFSIAHMRRMIPIFQVLTSQLQEILRRDVADGSKEIDMLEWMGRLALDLIGQAGLGYSFGALQGVDNDYARSIKSIGPMLSKVNVWRRLIPTLTSTFPAPVLGWLTKVAPWPTIQHLAEASNAMHKTSTEIWEEKKGLEGLGDEAGLNQLGEGRDLMTILLRANAATEETERLSDAELIAQMSTFILAGTETTSSALARILYLLTINPDAQETLRKELVGVDGRKGELDYDALNALPFLDAVCRETLRLFPPINFVHRVARQDFLLQLGTPFRGLDGKSHTELMVPSDTNIIVNIKAVNRDPDIWGPDALEWKPERWLAPLPDSVANARIPGVYSNQLTFIGGGRACIGFKFSQLEMKVVLSQLVSAFRFAPSAKKQVEWRWGGIASPYIVGGDSSKTQLPLTVSLA